MIELNPASCYKQSSTSHNLYHLHYHFSAVESRAWTLDLWNRSTHSCQSRWAWSRSKLAGLEILNHHQLVAMDTFPQSPRLLEPQETRQKVTPSSAVRMKACCLIPGFFFLATKYGGIDSGWCIYGGNHPHLLRNVFWRQNKNPALYHLNLYSSNLTRQLPLGGLNTSFSPCRLPESQLLPRILNMPIVFRMLFIHSWPPHHLHVGIMLSCLSNKLVESERFQ
jgi:hypothetical protein